jgi:hypothetical protein
VLLALMCVAVAAAWVREHRAAMAERSIADCFRGIAEENRVPQDRDCVR